MDLGAPMTKNLSSGASWGRFRAPKLVLQFSKMLVLLWKSLHFWRNQGLYSQMVFRAFWCLFRAHLGGNKGGRGGLLLADQRSTYVFWSLFLYFLLFLFDMFLFLLPFFCFFFVFCVYFVAYVYVFLFFLFFPSVSEIICVDSEVTSCFSTSKNNGFIRENLTFLKKCKFCIGKLVLIGFYTLFMCFG